MGERLKIWKKKLTKENMAIMALLGILLMVIAIPVKKRRHKRIRQPLPRIKAPLPEHRKLRKRTIPAAMQANWRNGWSPF